MNSATGTGADTRDVARHIFVTGAGGYVGRNVVRHLLANGHRVRGLVRRPEQAAMLERLGAAAVVGDLAMATLADAMAGCDALVHAAADTDHGRGGDRQWQVNAVGTGRVFDAAARAGVRDAVHLSSESVLADGAPLVAVDEDRPYPARHAGSYSRSKAEGERRALAADGPDMRVVVLRPRMVWGRDDTTALPMLVAMASAGKLAWIDGGGYLTTTTHIANLCHAIALALGAGGGGGIYFIGDAAPSPFRAFVGELLETQGIPVPDRTVPRRVVRALARLDAALAAVSGGRLSGPLTLQAYAASAVENTLDTTKARRELGYEPVVSRAEGMAELRAIAGRAR